MTELWALLYLHDWTPPEPGQQHRWEPGKNVWPAAQGVYATSQEAEALRKRMLTPEKYWVVRIPTTAFVPRDPLTNG